MVNGPGLGDRNRLGERCDRYQHSVLDVFGERLADGDESAAEDGIVAGCMQLLHTEELEQFPVDAELCMRCARRILAPDKSEGTRTWAVWRGYGLAGARGRMREDNG